MGIRVTQRSNQRGQVAVLFALVFTFMFVLFAMVIDVAHLINNKINLQLAADSAAYAGAAWQARTLNAIGMINYRMRQDLKELAMRVQVTHLRHNRNFPRGGDVINGAPGQADVDAFICQQAHGYVSESGVIYADDTNLCRNASAATGGLPPIVVPPVIAAFDPFEAAIAAQIRRIADAADKQCAAAAHDNQDLSQHLVREYSARSKYHEQQIGALADFLNSIPTGNPLSQSSSHPIAQAAYQSAIRNLTPANRSSFELEVLTPQESAPPAHAVGGVSPRFIAIEGQPMNASLLYVNFNVQGDGCVGQPGFLDFDSMDAGVSKVREVVTYFAVKASAVPDLLFIPRLWLDQNFPKIEAYAAAKPFGSRIGPENGIDPLLPVTGRPGNQSRIINFSFKPGDSLGMMNRKMMALFDAFHPLNPQSRPDGKRSRGAWPEPGQNSLALRAIHAPTVFDAIFYTVFPDPNDTNIGSDYLQPQFAKALFPDYIEAWDGQAPGGIAQQNGDALLQPGTPNPYYQNYLNGNLGRSGWVRIDSPGTGGGDAYDTYAEEQAESHGVSVAVGLPFITDTTARDFGFATRELVHSGWTPNGRDGQNRIGYSVKFVGIDALTGKLQVTTSSGPKNIANFPSPASSDRNGSNLSHTIH